MVWGDVRLDFFKHADSSRQSKRKLAFFLVFHTAFYTGEVSLEFGKKKLDILCKDSKNKKTDSDFEVDLRVSYDPSSHALLSQEETFKKLVMRQGTKMTFTAGQTILKANENKVRKFESCIRMIEFKFLLPNIAVVCAGDLGLWGV